MKLVQLVPYLLMISLAAAANDEMTTEVKPGTSVPGTAPTSKPVITNKATAGKKLDPALRAKIRRRAPFWIDDANHGAAIRINKDGTFSAESQGGGAIAGSWRAFKDELFISWSDGGENYGYPVQVRRGEVLIHGRPAKKNRYSLSGR